MHVTCTAHAILKLQVGWLTNANTQDSIIIFHNDKWPSAFILLLLISITFHQIICNTLTASKSHSKYINVL